MKQGAVSWDYHFELALKSSLLYNWKKAIGNVETGQTNAGGKDVIMVLWQGQVFN